MNSRVASAFSDCASARTPELSRLSARATRYSAYAGLPRSQYSALPVSTPHSIAWLPNRNTTSKVLTYAAQQPARQLLEHQASRIGPHVTDGGQRPTRGRAFDHAEPVEHHQGPVHVHRIRRQCNLGIVGNRVDV